MKQIIRIWLSILVISSFAQAQTNYEEWLRNEGFYLLSPAQKEDFRKLPDNEKEMYIRNLWASLDQNPITPENEFEAEYKKRFEYAKKHYGIPSDRSKIYLLLGPPNAVDRHPNSDKYYPLEVWSYYSLGFRGLPPSLELMFFKRWGVGDYRLYSPLFDGFKALTPTGQNFQDQRTNARLKQMFDSNIVEAAEHLTVGAGVNESEQIRMVLQDPAALKKVLTQNQRPTVETTVVYQGFDSAVYTYSVPHEGGVFRTSIAMAVLPKYLTFEKDETRYQARVDLVGKIADSKGNEILRINDSPFLKLSDTEFEKAKSYLFGYQFDAYLLPGKYNLECLYRDYASNAAGKIEKSFEVVPLSGDLQLLEPLTAFKANQSAADNMPFGYQFKQYFPKENSTFNNGNTLLIYTALLNPRKTPLEGMWKLLISLKKNGESILEVTEDLPLFTSDPVVDLTRKLKLQNLIPGSYGLSVNLSRNNVLLRSDASIKIGDDAEVLGRMRIIAPSSAAPEIYHTNVALQYYYYNNLAEASRHVRIALDFAPSSYPTRSLSARIEKAKGNTDGAIQAYELLLNESPADTEGMFLVGKWYFEKREWEKASEMLKKAMSGGYYTVELLNQLAFAQIQLGKTAEAVDYWEKSLALDTNQPEIQQQVDQHKK